MSRVVWSPQALRDLESIRDFIALDSPVYASLVIQRLMASVERLGAFPKSGRIVPELGRSDMREVIRPPFGSSTDFPVTSSKSRRSSAPLASFVARSNARGGIPAKAIAAALTG